MVVGTESANRRRDSDDARVNTRDPARCSNHDCNRPRSPAAVRVLYGEPAQLCSVCAENFDQQRFCQHCDQIYSDPTPPPQSWVSCYACHRFVHRQCELKSGTSSKSLLQGPGFFKCRACRERPTFIPAGGAFQRHQPLKDIQPCDAAQRLCMLPSPSNAFEDDETESDTDTEGVDPGMSNVGRDDRRLDFSSLILKAAEHVSALSLQSSPTFSPVSSNNSERTVGYYAAGADPKNHPPETLTGAGDLCYAQDDELEHKLKRRRSKSGRNEPATQYLGFASLPNMRKTKFQCSDECEGGEPRMLEYDWAQCDNPRCLKWRRLPENVPLDDLKGKWTCKLNRWDQERASCDTEEEDMLCGETLGEIKSDEGDYDVRKSEFYATLKVFLKDISCPMLRNPTLGGKDLDLYHLYREVTQRGGFDTVVAIEGTWARIFRTLPNYSPTVTDASYRLKRYYQEFLQSFEQRVFFRKDMRDITVQKFTSRRSKKSRTSMETSSDSPCVSAVVGTPLSKEKTGESYNIPPMANLPPPGPQCFSCKRRDVQLFPCETNGKGWLRVCSSIGVSDYYLVCRACFTGYAQTRSPVPMAPSPRLSSPPTAGSMYRTGGAFSPHMNFMSGMPNVNTAASMMKTGGGNKFYQSLPVQYPSPLP